MNPPIFSLAGIPPQKDFLDFLIDGLEISFFDLTLQPYFLRFDRLIKQHGKTVDDFAPILLCYLQQFGAIRIVESDHR